MDDYFHITSSIEAFPFSYVPHDYLNKSTCFPSLHSCVKKEGSKTDHTYAFIKRGELFSTLNCNGR